MNVSLISGAEILLTDVFTVFVLSSNHLRDNLDIHPFHALVKGSFVVALFYHHDDLIGITW